jgi:hypothetical protein
MGERSLRNNITVIIKMIVDFYFSVPCSPYVKRRFEGTYHLHLQGKISAAPQILLFLCPYGLFR